MQGNNSADLQGWGIVNEELKGCIDSRWHPVYSLSDTVVKDEQIIVEIGVGSWVFPSSIKAGKEIKILSQN